MKTSAFQQVVKDNFPEIKSVKSINRAGKLYLKVTMRSKVWNGSSYDYLLLVKDALRDYFPNIYMTSGGGGSATYRLNRKLN